MRAPLSVTRRTPYVRGMRVSSVAVVALFVHAVACAPLARPLAPPLFTAGCAAPAAAGPSAPGARSTRGDDLGAAAREEPPECRMGSDGRQACGYHCKMGSDGVMACADTPDGVCKMGADG